MSRSATPAMRNEATRRLKPPKRTTPAELPIGTAIRSSHERLRTVADGCDHKRNVERTHPQPPDPQSETGTLATHSGKIRVGVPNSRNVLFLQFFLKRAAQPSAGNTSAGFPWIKRLQIPLNLTWLCTKASQSFSGTFFGTFSGTLLNLTWLCTKA